MISMYLSSWLVKVTLALSIHDCSTKPSVQAIKSAYMTVPQNPPYRLVSIHNWPSDGPSEVYGLPVEFRLVGFQNIHNWPFSQSAKQLWTPQSCGGKEQREH